MVFKKRLYLYIALLAMALLTMLAIKLYLAGRKPALRDYDQIRQEGILRMTTDYTPLSYYLTDDTIIGFEYDMAQLLSRVSGLEVQLFPEVNLEKSLEGLQQNQYDVVGRLIPVTSANLQLYSFTQPLLLNKQVLVQRKEDNGKPVKVLRNQLELAEETIHIINDIPTKLRISNLSHEIGDTIYTQIEKQYGYEQLIMMVARGEIDYAVCDESIARKMQERYPNLDINTDISFTQFQSWAVRQESPALLDSLNAWIDRIKTSKEFEQILKRHYKRAPLKNLGPTDSIFQNR